MSSAFCFLPSAFCLLLSAFCLLLSAFCLLPSAYCLLRFVFKKSPCLRVSLPPIPRHLPDQALSSKLTIKFWIDAFAAKVDIQTLAALPAEPGLMFLTDSNRLSVRMTFALHLIFSNIHSRLILS